MNPDGSNGEGAVITLDVRVYSDIGPLILSSNPRDGDKNLDPDVLNRDGIQIEFDKPVFKSSLLLTIEGLTVLNWKQTIEGRKVILKRLNGEALRRSTTYIIKGTVKGEFTVETPIKIEFTTK